MSSLPVGTEMFHFPTFPPHVLCIQTWVTGHDPSRVSPFGHPRIKVRLPTPRGLSQAPTSFFGFWCQGIHRAPLLTWLQRFDARVHCAVLKVRAGRRLTGRLVRDTRTGSNRLHGPSKERSPDPSGPNSVQVGRLSRTRSTPRRVVLAYGTDGSGPDRCSTHEPLGRTYACTSGFWIPRKNSERTRCSLERR